MQESVKSGAQRGAPDWKSPPPLSNDPDLAAIVDIWPSLPPALKTGILAMVKAVGGLK